MLLSLDIDTGLLGRYDFENPPRWAPTAARQPDTRNGERRFVGGGRYARQGAEPPAPAMFRAPATTVIRPTSRSRPGSSSTARTAAARNHLPGRQRAAANGCQLRRLGSGGLLLQRQWLGRNPSTPARWPVAAGIMWPTGVNDAGDAATLYLDGAAVASTSTTASISYTLGASSFIGGHGSGDTSYDFTGMIDDARIYNRALTATEVAALAQDLS